MIRRNTRINTGSDDELFAEETKPNPASGLKVSIPSDAENEDMELSESAERANVNQIMWNIQKFLVSWPWKKS